MKKFIIGLLSVLLFVPQIAYADTIIASDIAYDSVYESVKTCNEFVNLDTFPDYIFLRASSIYSGTSIYYSLLPKYICQEWGRAGGGEIFFIKKTDLPAHLFTFLTKKTDYDYKTEKEFQSLEENGKLLPISFFGAFGPINTEKIRNIKSVDFVNTLKKVNERDVVVKTERRITYENGAIVNQSMQSNEDAHTLPFSGRILTFQLFLLFLTLGIEFLILFSLGLRTKNFLFAFLFINIITHTFAMSTVGRYAGLFQSFFILESLIFLVEAIVLSFFIRPIKKVWLGVFLANFLTASFGILITYLLGKI